MKYLNKATDIAVRYIVNLLAELYITQIVCLSYFQVAFPSILYRMYVVVAKVTLRPNEKIWTTMNTIYVVSVIESLGTTVNVYPAYSFMTQ